MYCELHPFSDVVVDPQEVAEEQELHHVLLSAVQALSHKERVATLLFYYEQLSLQEIAAILGISVTAVKSRLFKARKHPRRQLLPTSEEVQPILKRTERKCAMIKVTLAAYTFTPSEPDPDGSGYKRVVVIVMASISRVRRKNIFHTIIWYYCFDTAMFCSSFIFRRKEWWQGVNPAPGIDDPASNDRWEIYLLETVRE